MKKQAFSALVVLGCIACGKEIPTGAIEQPFPSGNERFVVGAKMSIAWPFGSEDPARWTGDEEDKDRTTGLCSSSGCTHSGADHHARDLSRAGDETGTMVYAGFSGKVVLAGWQNGYGNTVVIYDVGRRVAVRYAHLNSIGVQPGWWVTIRQFIGTVGSTGFSTGPHLHVVGYENIDHFDQNGNPVIPTSKDSSYYACAIYFFC